MIYLLICANLQIMCQDDWNDNAMSIACSEVTYLNQEPQIDILALWFFPVHLTVLIVPDVNSLEKKMSY